MRGKIAIVTAAVAGARSLAAESARPAVAGVRAEDFEGAAKFIPRIPHGHRPPVDGGYLARFRIEQTPGG